jgi:hypothetical protein
MNIYIVKYRSIQCKSPILFELIQVRFNEQNILTCTIEMFKKFLFVSYYLTEIIGSVDVCNSFDLD